MLFHTVTGNRHCPPKLASPPSFPPPFYPTPRSILSTTYGDRLREVASFFPVFFMSSTYFSPPNLDPFFPVGHGTFRTLPPFPLHLLKCKIGLYLRVMFRCVHLSTVGKSFHSDSASSFACLFLYWCFPFLYSSILWCISSSYSNPLWATPRHPLSVPQSSLPPLCSCTPHLFF